jgi:hypothetical protein
VTTTTVRLDGDQPCATLTESEKHGSNDDEATSLRGGGRLAFTDADARHRCEQWMAKAALETSVGTSGHANAVRLSHNRSQPYVLRGSRIDTIATSDVLGGTDVLASAALRLANAR